MLFCACEKKVDATNREKLTMSISEISLDLPEDKSQKFKSSIDIITSNTDILKALSVLHGKNVDQVIELGVIKSNELSLLKDIANLKALKEKQDALLELEKMQKEFYSTILSKLGSNSYSVLDKIYQDEHRDLLNQNLILLIKEYISSKKRVEYYQMQYPLLEKWENETYVIQKEVESVKVISASYDATKSILDSKSVTLTVKNDSSHKVYDFLAKGDLIDGDGRIVYKGGYCHFSTLSYDVLSKTKPINIGETRTLILERPRNPKLWPYNDSKKYCVKFSIIGFADENSVGNNWNYGNDKISFESLPIIHHLASLKKISDYNELNILLRKKGFTKICKEVLIKESKLKKDIVTKIKNNLSESISISVDKIKNIEQEIKALQLKIESKTNELNNFRIDHPELYKI